MEWSEWRPIYEEAVSVLGLSVERDEEAAEALDNLLRDRALTLSELRIRLGGGAAIVFGEGETLRRDLEGFLGARLLGYMAIVAVEGAVETILEKGITPHIVVTRLGRGGEALVEASRREAVTVIQAHGGNLEKLREIVPRLPGPLLGVTRAKPVGTVYSLGGFTGFDGALYLLEALGFDTIALAGVGLGREAGELERGEHAVALMILERFASTFRGRLYNVSDEEVKGFRKVSFEELSRAVGNIYSRPWGFWRK